MRACVRACVCVCVRACVRACMCVCVIVISMYLALCGCDGENFYNERETTPRDIPSLLRGKNQPNQTTPNYNTQTEN